jgi:hypothetical protein
MRSVGVGAGVDGGLALGSTVGTAEAFTAGGENATAAMKLPGGWLSSSTCEDNSGAGAIATHPVNAATMMYAGHLMLAPSL